MKVLLIGSKGRMGKQMQNYMTQNEIEYFAVDKDNFSLAEEVKFDVIVDFSTPDALMQNLRLAVKIQKPILIATTGHDDRNEHMLKLASKKIPVAVCPNLSVGIMVLNKMLKAFQAIKDFDFVLTEVHHKQKRDNPSGTAKQLLSQLKTIDISADTFAVRAGNVFGEHEISAYGKNEIVSIKHIATSRDCFCEGAIKVCEKLIGKPNGVYSIEDLL